MSPLRVPLWLVVSLAIAILALHLQQNQGFLPAAVPNIGQQLLGERVLMCVQPLMPMLQHPVEFKVVALQDSCHLWPVGDPIWGPCYTHVTVHT